jgi:DNA modification methylase
VTIFFPGMKIEQLPTDTLIPYARNTRTHSEAQVAQIAGSIREFGFTNPILIDGENGIIAGHGRVLAAQKLGLGKVPCIRLSHLTDTQRRAYIIADNKLALNAGWDEELLGLELADLREEGFDLELTGFDGDELANLLAETTEGQTDPDEVPEPPVDPVSVLGDVWVLGRHRIACGDCTDPLVVERAKGGSEIDHVVTDPPYGLGKKMSGGTWATKASHYSDMHDWDKVADEEFLQVILAENVPSVVWGGNYFAVEPSRCWLVWNKPVFPTMSDAELAWTNLDKNTKRFDSSRVHQTDGQKLHPTQKPVELIKWCFEFVSGDHCFEPFSGSGTTIIAGEMTGRCVHAIELNPAYVDVAVTRWQDFTGKQAIHEASGKTFDELKAEKP